MSDFRVGQGWDVHRIVAGRPMILGGVTIPSEFGLEGHSDADILSHAVTDALLGAAALGDIGMHFPDTDPRWKGAASRLFVEEAMREVRAAGYRVVNVDVTVLAEKPKLKAFKLTMKQSLESLVGGAANLKAGTNEGCDAIGRGEAIAASAVVLLALEKLA